MHAILVGLLSVSHTPEQADHAAREVLKQHAHELAEQQRRWADEENFILPVEVDGRDVPTIARQVARILADLINPEAQT